MFETIISFVEELRQNFRVVDAIDILLVSFFLYGALLWFQRTASRGVLIGFAALAMVYFLARGLDMYLTSLAFHTSFAVLLFLLVVVFQEDLRRLLERVSSIHPLRLSRTEDLSLELDTLVESVFHMSKTRTGALIVIKGREPLARHLNGGIVLNGRVSLPLLFSIFDSHTPGHDGAVVVERDKVTQFAAHLPISVNSDEIAGRGTRHSAAIGLSERSDALTIVVSEERGTVSVAQAGHLIEVATAAELKQRLETFAASTYPIASQPSRKQILFQNVHLKMLAVAVAVLAWFVLAYDPNTIQRTFVVPIEYRNLAAQLEYDPNAPNEARVTLTGSERNFRFLDPGTLKITLDMAERGIGFQEIQVSDENIRLPGNLSIYRIEPRIARLYLQNKRPKVEPTQKTNGGPQP